MILCILYNNYICVCGNPVMTTNVPQYYTKNNGRYSIFQKLGVILALSGYPKSMLLIM